MSDKTFRFEQKKSFVEEGSAASFNADLAFPVNVHANSSRAEITHTYLVCHTPTVALNDGSTLIVFSDVAYVRGGTVNYNLKKGTTIEVSLSDGLTQEIDTSKATVRAGEHVILPRCTEPQKVEKAALKLMDDPKFSELNKNRFKTAESEQEYNQYFEKFCKKHDIKPELKEKEGSQLPAHEQNRDRTYLLRLVNVVPKIEAKVADIIDEYRKEKNAREKPKEDIKLKEAVSALNDIKLKDAGNVHLMSNHAPIFAHLENNNLAALS